MFAFAIVEGGCTPADEAQWRIDGTEPVCDHRYDSGRKAALNGITCWQGTFEPLNLTFFEPYYL